jgi:hypothetical protein
MKKVGNDGGMKMMRANRKDEKLLLALMVGLAGISKTEGTRRVFNPSPSWRWLKCSEVVGSISYKKSHICLTVPSVLFHYLSIRLCGFEICDRKGAQVYGVGFDLPCSSLELDVCPTLVYLGT